MTEYRRAGKDVALYSRVDGPSGRLVKLVPDDLGIITISSEAERRVAEAIGLPVTKLPRLDSDEVAKAKKKE